MNSHADSHDRDKLARWHRDLSVALLRPGGRFPLYAVFLVSAEDRAAHDIFRQFRTSFEERAAGFEQLVIFGQHGVSSTVRGLLSQFGLPLEATPTLALFADPAVVTVYTLPIPAGSGSNEGSWRQVLAQVESAADQGSGLLELVSVRGITGHRMDGETLLQHVGGLLDRLSGFDHG